MICFPPEQQRPSTQISSSRQLAMTVSGCLIGVYRYRWSVKGAVGIPAVPAS